MPKKHVQIEERSPRGKARMLALTPEKRSEVASIAARARWFDKPIQATHSGTIRLGDIEIECAVLPDGRRVLSERAVLSSLGRGHSGHYSQRDAKDGGAAVQARFVAPIVLAAFIPAALTVLLSKPIPYVPAGGGSVAKGVPAEALPLICGVWFRAAKAGVLNEAQGRTAERAETMILAFSEVGIVALIDEATGYQEKRDKDALQLILDRFLRKELAAWARRFPTEFYKEIFRLRGWTWKGMQINRPSCVGTYTKDIVYARMAPDLVEEIQTRMPKTNGRRNGAWHQLLTDDIGHPALTKHLHAVIALMRAAQTWDQFIGMIDRAFPKYEATMLLPLMADAETES